MSASASDPSFRAEIATIYGDLFPDRITKLFDHWDRSFTIGDVSPALKRGMLDQDMERHGLPWTRMSKAALLKHFPDEAAA